MSTATMTLKLPPLILHPFAQSSGRDKLIQSSRASLMLQGLLPAGERPSEELDEALLEGRFHEVRMLYYVGRDLMRWIDQCLEFAQSSPALRDSHLRYQSFAGLLIHQTPAKVEDKLRKWGVSDYRSIFMRALGLNSLFAEVPGREILSNEFIRNYYRYADQMYHCRQSQFHASLDSLDLDFDLYASGEYSRMLERAWEEQ